MKYIFIPIITLLFLACIGSEDSETVISEAAEINCDSICRALLLEGHLQELRNNKAALDPIKDSLLVNKYLQQSDSIYSLLESYNLERKSFKYYDDTDRNHCLECWADQLNANLNDMALAAANAENRNRSPASWLSASLELVQSFTYLYNDKGEPYYMRMGKRIIVTDTIQNKIAHQDTINTYIERADSIIKPVFGKSIIEFSFDELTLYKELTEYEHDVGYIPIDTKSD